MKTNAQLDDLSTKLGDLVHNWGFKRIHGRIWTRLFLSSRPLDAADLIEQLDISKALVSISLRELLEVKAVEEVGRSARGTNLFRANHDLNSIYLETLKKRERTMLEQTAAAVTALAALEASDLNAVEVSTAQMDKLAHHLESAMTMLASYVDKNEQADSSHEVVSFNSASSATPLKAASDSQNGGALQARAGY